MRIQWWTFCHSFINLTDWRERRVTCQQLIGDIKQTRKKLPLERSRVNSRLEGDTCTQLSKCFPHPIYCWVITIRNTWIPLSVEPKPHILPSDLLWEWRIDLSNPKKRKQNKTNGKKNKQNKISGNWGRPTRRQVVSLLYFYSNTLTTSLISSFFPSCQ